MYDIRFNSVHETFQLDSAENSTNLYFPIAGEKGLKASVNPNLLGDAMLDQETFLLEPITVEGLHNNKSSRNFWLNIHDRGIWSASGNSARQEEDKFTKYQDKSLVEAGYMWHRIKRVSNRYMVSAEITSFIPADENVEIMMVHIENLSGRKTVITPVAAIPVFGRSADNIRDHRNVTSMLNRIKTTELGIRMKPTLSFDEKGHRKNEKIYYVSGFDGSGNAPVSFYPTVYSFIGEGGSFTCPRALYREENGVKQDVRISGREAMGGIRFADINLRPGEGADYIVLIGVSEDEDKIRDIESRYRKPGAARKALDSLSLYWRNKVNVSFETGDAGFDHFMQWVTFQPILRRIFGCSFLPWHDYGRGGRGWRDLWQDCLSLLFMEPDDVRDMITANFAGVRIDGTNATIIGEERGSFIADRNGIARVWMDHGFWPLRTLMLYMDQTGDFDILNEEVNYFSDSIMMRGTQFDKSLGKDGDTRLKDVKGNVYTGTVLEHVLIQNLTAVNETGEHGMLRLRGADWNDALDMAPDKGESVAFTFAYTMNLWDLADYMEKYAEITGNSEILILKELEDLLAAGPDAVGDTKAQAGLLNEYCRRCMPLVSGERVPVSIKRTVTALRKQADLMCERLREQEWLPDTGKRGWFNSYYDNDGNRVERVGKKASDTRMMLTGQVFAIMSSVADKDMTAMIARAADHYLYRKEIGGYRLNTDFGELKLNMGRMFGFSYGEKENGAVFSHMTVMYAYALYKRGFVREGYKALRTLYEAASDFEKSRMYPGIPEYFNIEGRGVYTYLTGAASWYLLTMITQVFGVRGEAGELIIEPKLMPEQFDENGEAVIGLFFRGRKLKICICNRDGSEYGRYKILSACCNGEMTDSKSAKDEAVRIELARLKEAEENEIKIIIGKKPL
jgi:cellobiose phosphorylase